MSQADAFFQAIKENKPLIIQKLLDEGLDINVTEKTKNGSGLHWSAFYGLVEISRLLLDSGANINAYTLDESAQTPLIWAIYAGNFETVKFLLDKGAIIDLVEGMGMSPFSVACHKGHTLIAHYLFFRGAKIDIMDKDKHTPLHWAAYSDRLSAVRYLLEERSVKSIDQPDSLDRTPLHWAAKNGNLDVVQYLISRGCDYHCVDSDGNSPYQLAVIHKEAEIAEYIQGIINGSILPSFSDEPKLFFKDITTRRNMLGTIVPAILLPLLLFASNYVNPYLFVLMFIGWFVALFTGYIQDMRDRHYVFVGYFLAIVVSTYWAFLAHIQRNGMEFDSAVIMFFMFFAMTGTYWWTAKSDPGVIPRSKDIFERVENGIFNDRMYCQTCMVIKPFRSKHEKFINACIERYDHYCVWFSMPIGRGNHRRFMWFVLSTFLCLSLHNFFTLRFLWRSPLSLSLFFWENAFITWAHLIHGTIFVAFTGSLLFQQCNNILANMTVNEGLNFRRYPYLLTDSKGALRMSMYDNGFADNWAEFWKDKSTDPFKIVPSERTKKIAMELNLQCPEELTMYSQTV